MSDFLSVVRKMPVLVNGRGMSVAGNQVWLKRAHHKTKGNNG